MRLRELEALDQLLLRLLEKAKLADTLAPQLVKHKVGSLDVLASWQPGSLVKILGLTSAVAAKLRLDAKTEVQLAQGRSIAVSVISHRSEGDHTKYLIETTTIAPDGRRKPFRVQKRVAEFCTLHNEILSVLSPRLPTAFPIAKVPKFLHGLLISHDKRKQQLEDYLQLAVESSDGRLPPALAAFLGLPDDSIRFEPSGNQADPTPPSASGAGYRAVDGEGKAIVAAEWEFPHARLAWVRQLGAGGFGEVFEVHMGGMVLAGKKTSTTVPSEREAVVSMYRREFRALKEVQHENIVTLIGVCVDDPKAVTLLMELASLGSLRSLLDTQPAKVVGMLAVQKQLLHGVAAGMACLHAHKPRPILHHDLKTDNVLVWPDEATGGFRPKITDFGLATGTGQSTMRTTQRRQGAGTLAYKAPECYKKAYDMASEVYAFAIVGWEVLTGQLPWQEEDEASLVMTVVVEQRRPPFAGSLGGSAVLTPLIERCWAHEPSKRPSFAALATAAELAPPAAGAGDGVSASDVVLAMGDKMDAVLSMQQQMGGKMDALHADLKRMHSAVRANASMLGALLQGEHDCPRWLVLLPKPSAKSAVSRSAAWLMPQNWINQTVVLHFVCPVTRTAVGKGFELKLPRDWVTKYGPVIRVGLTLLKLGAGAARAAGVPVPTLAEVTGLPMGALGEQLAYLQELRDGISKELDSAGLGFVNEWAAEQLESAKGEVSDLSVAKAVEGLPTQLTETVQRSYAEVRALLDGLEPTSSGWEAKVRDPKRCGLVKAVCSTDEHAPYEWVEQRWRVHYEQRGRALLEMADEEREMLE